MNDEIKEILECMEQSGSTTELVLLDYITNLQQERNMFKGSFETMSKNYFEEKSRNEKAIEYIENDLQISILPNNQIINGKEVVKRINKIINILQNGSDDNE